MTNGIPHTAYRISHPGALFFYLTNDTTTTNYSGVVLTTRVLTTQSIRLYSCTPSTHIMRCLESCQGGHKDKNMVLRLRLLVQAALLLTVKVHQYIRIPKEVMRPLYLLYACKRGSVRCPLKLTLTLSYV